MIKLITFLAAIFVATAANEINWAEQVKEINNAQNYWTAAENEITSRGYKYMKTLLGAKRSSKDRSLPVKYDYETPVGGIPTTFDARKNWPKCQSISAIRDQGYCGSCWAVAASSAMSDRLCIKTKGKFTGTISAENLMCCCSDCVEPQTGGCDGGYPEKAWDYFMKKGIVTGGDYQSNDGCQPYEIAPSPGTSDEEQENENENLYTPPCYTKKCTNSKYKKSYKSDKHYGKSSYFVPEDVSKIQTEILTNGPVEAAFDVYSDFFSYKSGVYVKHSNYLEGGHAVRLMGWGVENNVDYWLVANSWNTTWGDNGTFKIRRGTNECGFEEYITTGIIKK